MKYSAKVFYEIGDHLQKISSFGREKKTKIRHRMVTPDVGESQRQFHWWLTFMNLLVNA